MRRRIEIAFSEQKTIPEKAAVIDRNPIIPAGLNPGDKIGIAAPSAFFDAKRLREGVAYLEKKGFRVFIPADVFYRNGYFAGSDKRRAGHIQDLFEDPSIKAVFCARGGYGSIRILPYLNLDLIQANPKIFLGFSDITVLLNVFSTHCGIVTFHGPVINSFPDTEPADVDFCISALRMVSDIELRSENGLAFNDGVAGGETVGGNLATLCHLLGTPYQPLFKNRILILEDVNEPPYKIDRMLNHLKFAGCCENLSGLALGEFTDCCGADELYRIVRSVFKNYDFPVLFGLKIGHGRFNTVFPVGSEAVLDTEKKTLTFKIRDLKDLNVAPLDNEERR